MNVIIPLAGISNFDISNNYYPLPLRDIYRKPLIQYVIENLLKVKGENKFIFILKEEDCMKFHLDNTLKLLIPNCEIVILKNKTAGSVCSILMATDRVNLNTDTIVVNADQIFKTDINNCIDYFRDKSADVGVITFDSVHPRWSYVKCDDNGNVLQAVEKNPISRFAIAGFYYFKSFTDFKLSAFNAIEVEDYYNECLYTSALINQMILLNKKVLNKVIAQDDYMSFYSAQKINEFERYISEKDYI